MNLTQLKCFISVAELENMSKASEYLHTGQSAVSKNITKLEQELDCTLFTRNGKNIELNPAGKRFLECANQVVTLVEEAKEDLNILDDRLNRKIRLGMATGCRGLGKCIHEFEKTSTEAEFELNGSAAGSGKLDISNYDAIIYPEMPEYGKYKGFKLYSEKCFMGVNAKNPLADELAFNVKKLADQRVIFMRDGNRLEYTHRLLHALSIKPAHFCYTDLREVHKQMISDNVALGFVPEGSAEFYRDSRIKLIPILDSRFERNIIVSFRKEKYLPDLAKDFKSFMLGYYNAKTE